MRPKDPLPVTEQSAVVYSIPCQDCDARYVGETGKRLGTRLHEHQLAVNRKDKLSLVYGHTLERNHNFAFEKARVVGRANDKMARLMLESWSSNGTLNRAIDLHPAYQALRARLESVRAGPMAGMKRVTRGRLPTLAERGEGADRNSRDRRGTLSHGRTREAGNSTPEEKRSISPPSDEGEANEHADAAATTLGVRETQGTPVRQWLRSDRPQSANKKQADQRTVRGAYAPLAEDPTKKQAAAIKKKVNELARLKLINPNDSKFMTLSDPRIAHAYGLPTVHKPDAPLRKIVPLIGSPTYSLAKWLYRHLKHLADGSQYSIKNSQAFLEKIQGLKSTTILAAYEDIKEGQLVVLFLLHRELNFLEDGIEMFLECQHLIPFDDDEGIIHIPGPELRFVVLEDQRL
ncbi:hypothetical protein SprV_0602234500 [Sparganum proliferum]